MKRRRSTGGAVPKIFKGEAVTVRLCAKMRNVWPPQQHWALCSARNVRERCESFRQQRGCVCVCSILLSFYFPLSHRNTHTHTHSVALITPPPSQLARPTPLLAFVRQPPLSFWPSRLRHSHHLLSSITQGPAYILLSGSSSSKSCIAPIA